MDVIDSPAQSLLKIRLTEPVVTGQNSKGEDVVEKTALVPFVEALVPDIDLEEQYLTLDPPGGLIPGCGMDLTHEGGRCACSAPPYVLSVPKRRSTHGSYPSTAWSGPDGRRPRHRAAAVTRVMKRPRNSGTSTPKATCVCLSGS